MTDPWQSPRLRWGIALLLVLAAAVPRAHRLGEESLTGDEDYSWIAATAVAEGRGSVMPSGMPYRRGLPFTWANAAVVSLLGAEDNASVRVVAAAAGSVTPAAVFLAGSSLVPPPAALAGAALLTVSEWHVTRSRHGRMYPLLALTFFLTGVLFWRWARRGGAGRGAAALGLLAATVSLHLLGLPAAQTALFAVVLPGALAVSPWAVLAVVASATAALHHLNRVVVQAPYAAWALPRGYRFETATTGAPGAEFASQDPHALPVVLGVAVGVWWASRAPGARPVGLRGALTRLAGAGAVVVVAVAVMHGLLVAAGMAAVVALLLDPRSPGRRLRAEALPIALVCAVGVGWLAVAMANGGVDAGLRRVAAYPYLYLRSLWPVAPALVTLFLVGTAGLVWPTGEATSEERPGLRAAALAAWVPLVGLGFAAPHGPARYAFMLLPFVAIVAAWPLVALARVALDRWRPGLDSRAAAALAIAAIFAGILPGHGIVASWRATAVDYGSAVDPFPADHETPGRFLAEVLRPEDLVIAEDETMAYVYAGRVDYWFRRAPNARRFSYLDAEGVPRSKYTGARILVSARQVDEVAAAARGRVWFVSTKETTLQPRFYHSPDQAAWLAALRVRGEPAIVGEDGLSAVYCLNC